MVACLLGSEGPGDELGAVKSPKEALACKRASFKQHSTVKCVCVCFITIVTLAEH